MDHRLALERNLVQRVCVGDIVTRSASRFPDKVAIIDGNVRLTFRQFNERVNCLGNALLELGAAHQDVVAIMCPNRWEMLVSYFACAKAGLIAMPVNRPQRPRDGVLLERRQSPFYRG